MICPACGKKGSYIRLTTREIVCRFCGAITPMDDKNENKHSDR